MPGQFVLQFGSVESAAKAAPRRTSRGTKKSTKKRAADEEAAEKASRASLKKKQKSSASGEARSAAATATDQASAAAIAEELPQPECAPTVATSTADGTDTSSTSVPVAALIEKDGIDIDLTFDEGAAAAAAMGEAAEMDEEVEEESEEDDTSAAAAKSSVAPLPLRPSVPSKPAAEDAAEEAAEDAAEAEAESSEPQLDAKTLRESVWSAARCKKGHGRPEFLDGEVGPNPPTKRKSNAACWRHCKFILLTSVLYGAITCGSADTGLGTATHVCTFPMEHGGVCGHFYHLYQAAGKLSWTTTGAARHMKLYHPDAASTAKKAATIAIKSIASLGNLVRAGSAGSSTLQKYVQIVTPRQKLFTMQVRVCGEE